MTDDDAPDRPGTETDWLANSIHGYGFGYTKEQALAALARHVSNREDKTHEVALVEHFGEAKVGPGGWEVEEEIGFERVEMPNAQMMALKDASIEAQIAVEEALNEATTVEDRRPDQ